ncbi:diguanylate cyclase [Marinomonas ostreistagni]|uniref:diguanylate cyclase n=1 Tax=Marinomonas ostreistagni TaxID=359209 RepID=A0ABS0Z8D2_9GAMM|nr:diguanylate cyclase [Marinomonas ostreistagni]MBJ7549901.1 diguanylate cyclase [Marinomonas ostreistagni]
MPHQKRQELINKYSLARSEDSTIKQLVSSIAQLFDVPVTMTAIAHKGHFVFQSRFGLEVEQSPIEDALCGLVLKEEQQVIIPDLLMDKRYTQTKLLDKHPDLRFYAGTPLVIEGTVIGSLCLVDTRPRHFTPEQCSSLTQLSSVISDHLALKKEHYQLQNEHSLLDQSPAVMICWRYDNGLNLQTVTRNVKEVLGLDYEYITTHQQSFESFLSQPSQEEFHFMIQNHLSGVETTETKLELNQASNSIWVRLLSKAFFDQTGRLQTIHAIATDHTEQQHFEKRLNDTNRQMRLLLEASELGTWDYRLDTDHTQVNKRWCDIIGVDYEFYDGSSRFWRQRIHPADLSSVSNKIEAHLKGETNIYSAIYRMRHENNSWVWIETYGRVVERDEMGKAIRLAGTHRDITERKLAEIHQMKQSQLLGFINKARAAYLENHDLSSACQAILPELIDIADSQFAFIGQIVFEENKRRLFIHAISELSWNSASEALVELYKGRKLYFDSFDNLFGETIKSEQTVISNQLGSHPASVGTPKGHPPIYRFMGLPIQLQGEVTGMIGLANKFNNYTNEDAEFLQPLRDALAGLFHAVELEKARLKAEDQLLKMAMTDTLSGLSNRRAFREYLGAVTSSDKTYFAIIDIDHFKRINDQFGHEVGDEVIRQIGAILKEKIMPPHFIARIGGEEFAIVLHDLESIQAASFLNDLIESIRLSEFPLPDNSSVTVSVGLAKFYEDNSSTALSNADKALYEAKELGRDRLVSFADIS